MQNQSSSSSPNTPQTHHTFRTVVLWLAVLILLLVIVLFFIGRSAQKNTPSSIDPAAQFLRDSTRSDISEQDIAEAGQFLQDSTAVVDPVETLVIDAFFQETPATPQEDTDISISN
ncbi:hypothetical protein H6776_00665 [Candidatus Nomurabacteria bacterium]|nr:hypothetical protein [Candidatus Nomurabacteria bacterium]